MCCIFILFIVYILYVRGGRFWQSTASVIKVGESIMQNVPIDIRDSNKAESGI